MTSDSAPVFAVDKLIAQARRLALEYRQATGKTLPGISAEIALYDAARFVNLELPKETNPNFDAIGKGKREGQRIQIKGRVIFDEQKGGQRVGQLKLEQEWDSVMLVIMNDQYESVDIYELDRQALKKALEEDSGKRSKRGAMTIAKFKAIGQLVWTAEQ